MTSSPIVASSFTTTAVVFEAALLGAALVLGPLFGRPPFADFEWTALDIAYGLSAATPLFIGLLLVTRYPVGPFKELERISQELLVPLFAQCSWMELLAISALAGMGEEALFRGVVQAGLQQWWGSPWVALIVASVLFGLAHMITPTYAVVAGIIGAYLGWLWLATGNLLAPIVTHGAYDFAALVYLLSRQRPGTDSAEIDTLAEDDFGVA